MKRYILLLTIAGVYLYGCKNNSTHDHSHETAAEHAAHNHDGHDHKSEGHDHDAEIHPEQISAENHSDEIIFTKAQAAKTEFEVSEIRPGSFHQIIKTTGQILPAPGDESVIVATNNGVISYANDHLTPGSPVRQGETLFYTVSKNLSEGDYYARIQANYQKAKTEFERAGQLIKDKIISQKEYDNILLNYQNAKISYDALSGKQTAKGLGIHTPISGYIKNINIRNGEYVTAGQPIATVSQNKRLVLRADVSEKHYNSLSLIKSANFKTPYDNQVYALSALSGKLLSTGKSPEANTFFIPVSFEFDNVGPVVPGSFVEVYLFTLPQENVISIPLTALTNESGYFYVYKQLDAEGYQKQEVQIGANDGKNVQILSGLSAGDRIVTKGAYQVKMASSAAAIPGHTHEH